MKIKCRPEDFRVEERPIVTPEPGGGGPYTFYRLTKRGMGTPEAIEAIRRRWNLSARQIQYAGLKDRHAETTQYVTIEAGPNKTIREPSLTLEPLGSLPHPYGPTNFRGNQFVIVLRDLTPRERDRARQAATQLPVDGLPNYFDDQRFGSVGFGGGFIAEAWFKGDHERAFWLAMAEPTPSDRPDAKAAKAILRETWGNWAEAKTRLERSHTRSLVTYLVDHPTDFRGAFSRLNRNLRSIYFSAFQSHLWNLLLAGWITRNTRPEQRIEIPFKVATLPLQRGLDPDQAATMRSLQIPLPSARTPLPEGSLGELAREVLERHGLTWESLRVKHLKDVFLSKGNRPAVFAPSGFQSEEATDEIYPNRRKLTLTFELPKGAYATLVVKRLTESTREHRDA